MNAQTLIISIETTGKAAEPKRMPNDLCREAGINRATWQRIKAGKVKPSYDSLRALEALARSFGIDPNSPSVVSSEAA